MPRYGLIKPPNIAIIDVASMGIPKTYSCVVESEYRVQNNPYLKCKNCRFCTESSNAPIGADYFICEHHEDAVRACGLCLDFSPKEYGVFERGLAWSRKIETRTSTMSDMGVRFGPINGQSCGNCRFFKQSQKKIHRTLLSRYRPCGICMRTKVRFQIPESGWCSCFEAGRYTRVKNDQEDVAAEDKLS